MNKIHIDRDLICSDGAPKKLIYKIDGCQNQNIEYWFDLSCIPDSAIILSTSITFEPQYKIAQVLIEDDKGNRYVVNNSVI